MTTKLAVFDWKSLSDRNVEKLKAYQNDGWDAVLVGNGLDCQSRRIRVSECKKGMFLGDQEKEIYSVATKPNDDVYLVFADGSGDRRDYYEYLWVKENSMRAEVAKMQSLLKELDIKLGLLCPDNGFSVYFVRPYEKFYETYLITQCHLEGKGLNFQLPNDGMIEMAKQAFHYKETRTVYVKLWWIYREWQEKTEDQFVFNGAEVNYRR